MAAKVQRVTSHFNQLQSVELENKRQYFSLISAQLLSVREYSISNSLESLRGEKTFRQNLNRMECFCVVFIQGLFYFTSRLIQIIFTCHCIRMMNNRSFKLQTFQGLYSLRRAIANRYA